MALGIGLHRRRGIPAYSPPAGNVVTNWRGAGTGGTNGLPDGWNASLPAGVTLSVLSRTPYRGGFIIDFQLSGVAAANGNCLIQPSGTIDAPCAAGQTWKSSVFVEPVGTPLPSGMISRLSWRDGVLAFVGTSASVPLTGSIAGNPVTETAVVPAGVSYAWLHLILAGVTTGQSVSLRYKIFAPTLWRVS